MKKIAWLLPLEPFPSRYTQQWYDNFPKAFELYGYDVKVIDGEPLSNKIDVGSWLPMNSTVHYKTTQLAKVALLFQEGLVVDGDIFFIYDLEFWGVDAIKMMCQINKVDAKIFGFMHAASYTKEDLMEQLAPWQKYTELGWISLCDKVFVGSQYHKDAILERRIQPLADKADQEALYDKIIPTGNPVFKDEYHKIDVVKKNQVILPNRFDFEKRPNISLDIAYTMKKKHPDWNFVVTTSNDTMKSNKQWLLDKLRGMQADGIIEVREGLSKYDYHHAMAESKIMLTNSIEENFGYCLVEAMVYNTYPLAPKGLSHSELLGNNPLFLYEDLDEISSKMEVLMNHTQIGFNMQKHYEVINKIVAQTL